MRQFEFNRVVYVHPCPNKEEIDNHLALLGDNGWQIVSSHTDGRRETIMLQREVSRR